MDTEFLIPRSTASPSQSSGPESRHFPEQNTVSSTYAACRIKHLKCGGLQVCSRCATQGLECIYLKSRRGYIGPVANRRDLSVMSSSRINNKADSSIGAGHSVKPIDSLEMATVLCEPTSMFDFVLVNQSWASIQPTIASPDIDLRRRCTEAFFRYFYDAHPFLLPRQRYLESSKEGPPREHLETAIAYIGSRYVKGAPQSAFSLELDCFVLQHNLPRIVSTVQAMLLFAIGLDGNNEGKKAVEVLIKAQRFALDLGMNQREYAVVNGGGAFLCEESIRRTWWELYVVSVIVAALHGNRVFQLSGVISTTPLPCGTDDFANGVTPQLYTIEEFDEHSFLDPEVEWSSCAYRIAAARNLKRILETDSLVFLDDALICILDAILVNWNLHLPLSKVASYDQSGTFDEMIFQAHMITELSSLLLHRRFISLDATATQNIVSYTPQGTVQAYCSGFNNIHTSKATQAASNISKLVGMPTPLINHTQFFIRALTHSSISHVSLWSHLPLLAADENLKEEIRMNAGALREMGMVWPAAQMAYSQVTNAAAKVFESRRDAVGNAFGRDLIGSEIIDASLDLDCFTIGITDVNP